MSRKATWLYNLILAALLVTNFVILRRLEASEKVRQASRVEYREFRERFVGLIAANNLKHNELTVELKRLKYAFATDTQRLRRLERVLPAEAMADRSR